MLIGAHRGAYKEFNLPENSLIAVEKAIEIGCDFIEFDIHKTIDGELIVYHDDQIEFNNKIVKLKKATLDQLKSIDLGHNQSIPMLQEVVEICQDHKMKMNLEIKVDDIAQSVINLLIDQNDVSTSEFWISSFKEKVIEEINAHYSGIKTGLLYLGKPLGTKEVLKAKKLDCKMIHPYYRFISSRLINKARELNLDIFPWTVNNRKTFIDFSTKEDINGIITDVPFLMKNFLADINKTTI